MLLNSLQNFTLDVAGFLQDKLIVRTAYRYATETTLYLGEMKYVICWGGDKLCFVLQKKGAISLLDLSRCGSVHKAHRCVLV